MTYEEKPLTPCVPSRPLKLAKLKGPRGTGLGKRASKAYAGTIKRAPDDVTVRARVTRGTAVRMVEAHPGEWDRMTYAGMERPR